MLTQKQIDDLVRQKEESIVRELALVDNEENIRILRQELFTTVKIIHGEEIQQTLIEVRDKIVRQEQLKEKLLNQNELEQFREMRERHKRNKHIKELLDKSNKNNNIEKDTKAIENDWIKVLGDMKKVWSDVKSSGWRRK